MDASTGGILRGRSDPFHRVLRGADRLEQLLAVRLVARGDDELDLGLERARRAAFAVMVDRDDVAPSTRDQVEDAA